MTDVFVMPTVRFRVYGFPSPQGSKTAFVNRATGRAGMKESAGAKLTTWRHDVGTAAAAERALLDGPLDGALALVVVFRFPMPASRSAAVRQRGVVPKTSAPDTSKLVRALEDSLQAAGLITDDARFASIIADKVEVHESWTGAEVCVRPLMAGGA